MTTEKATVGVFWAGSIPYYTGRVAVDFLGKSDPVIARRPPDTSGAIAWAGMPSVPGHNKYDLDYSIKQRQPTYVQGLAWGRQDLSIWGQAFYVTAAYRGVPLILRRNSPEVRWEKLDPAPPTTTGR